MNRYLFNLLLVADGYPKSLDADLHGRCKGSLVNITEPAKCIRQLAGRQKFSRQPADRGENFPKAAYLPQHLEALSGCPAGAIEMNQDL